MQQLVLVVNPLQVRSTLGTALFEHRIDQLVLAGMVDVQEFDHVLIERTDHLHALRVTVGLGDIRRCRVQRANERLMDGVHVRHIGAVTVKSGHESPALAFDKTPQRTRPSKGFHGGTLERYGSKKPLEHRSLPLCRRVADGVGTPCLLPNRFGKLAASSIHDRSPERMFQGAACVADVPIALAGPGLGTCLNTLSGDVVMLMRRRTRMANLCALSGSG